MSSTVLDIKSIYEKALKLHQNGDLVNAETNYRQILESDPNHHNTLHLLGLIEFSRKNYDVAIELIEKSLVHSPNHAAAHYNLGCCFEESKNLEAAVQSYRNSIRLDSTNASAFGSLGNVLNVQKKYSEAIKAFDASLKLDPNSPNTYTNKGVTLYHLNQLEAALECHNKAISLASNFAIAYSNRGRVLTDMKSYDLAAKSLNHALKLDPNLAVAYLILSEGQNERGLPDEALTNVEKAMELDATLRGAFAARFIARSKSCSWLHYDEDVAVISSQAVTNSVECSPFSALATLNNRELQRKAAEGFVKTFRHNNDKIVEPIFSKTPKEKLRIGYLSVDFRDHPVSQLVAGLFENHDRNKFEIFAFSAGPNTIDDYQKRIVKAADQFFRVEKLSTPDLVKLMGEKQLDIAVDLSGYTTLTRSAIFAGHVAPVQVNYLGYSGTMGDEFMDYIIGDATIIPPDHQNDYAEKIVYMPNSYMPSDNSRIMSDRIFKRRELGLPEKGVVYCAFNNVTKLNPDCFSSWMRILKAVAGSVLWLNVKGTTARENLAKEAAARGIDPSRLIYTTYLASDEHFARYRSADIFLDSLPYNAHTTANEALWSGLPVLTQIGEAFAGRVAASLLKTVGLDELITHSKEEFETKAIALSLQPSEFERLKSQLAQNLKSSPLFNASLYARHIEDAFQQMHQRHVQGLRPDHIFINS